jgi:predicted Fe-Mo cluster-binding NifX family protein
MLSKICVSATGSSIDSQVDPRFGRCAYFIIADADTMDYYYLPNPAYESPHGAGIQAAQVVASQRVKAVITGMVGPNAHHVLSAAGIDVITGTSGTVKDAIQRYKSGELGGHFSLSPAMRREDRLGGRAAGLPNDSLERKTP